MKRIIKKSFDMLRMVSEVEPSSKKLVLATRLGEAPSRSQKRQAVARVAFTIVELLTVMSIIVILIGLLVPALNRVRIYAKTVKQMAQFHSIDAALELFNNEFDGYPPSGALDSATPPVPYCGVMKLCEAMMGQDMLGFHTNSVYRQDGMDAAETDDLYPPSPEPENLKARKGPFLPLESANAYTIKDIYGEDTDPFDPCDFILCDVYTRPMLSGQKTGMPILYYKANTANNMHYDPDYEVPPFPSGPRQDEGNIYNYYDNLALIQFGKPWVEGDPTSDAKKHSLVDVDRFYKNTRSHKITTAVRPYKADTYILLSAGYDGEYGTADDIFNFEWKYRP